ncbi:MAG TPA: hypothetical protein VJ960_03290 [Oceanipulchritudo sp.]|nr:hypothetical protein [Oceanipulchritudo sp.]
MLRKIEDIDEVTGVIIGRSYGGKSLGRQDRTGMVKIQRRIPGGFKAVTQTAKGLQEIFIRIKEGSEETAARSIAQLR